MAPTSWLTRRDVEGGRDELNFSRWDEDAGEADDAIETLRDGSMPPDIYQLVHRDAALSDEEVDRLVAALEALDEADRQGGDGGDGGEDGDNRGPEP